MAIRRTSCSWLVGLVPVLAAFLFVAPAAALVVHRSNGRFLGVQPRGGVSPAAITGSEAGRARPRAADPGVLTYNGGPVLHSSTPYLIFWTGGESTPSGSSQALMARYFSDVAADSGGSTNVFGVARQFTDGAGFADYRQTFNPASQTVPDTDSFPVNGCSDTTATFPRCLTDGQLQAELTQIIGARGLPTGIGPNAPIYFIVTPDDVNVCMDASLPPMCADGTLPNAFCAYHSFMTLGDGSTVLYASVPFFLSPDPSDGARYAKQCQRDGNAGTIEEPNGDLADVAISYLSHEDNETITDPTGRGWLDDTTGYEDGDECAGVETNSNAFLPTLGTTASGSLFDQLIGGHAYYTQSDWSNSDGGCEMRPTPGTISPRFTVPAPGLTPTGASATFDPTSSATTNPITSATWDFGDGSPPQVLSGFLSLQPPSHAYSAPGRYGVTLTLVDDRGNVAPVTESIVVGSAPSLGWTSSRAKRVQGTPIDFSAMSSTDADAGVTIASYHWSFGDGSSADGGTTAHAYRTPGTYTVSLTATNSLGISATASRRVTIARAQVTRIGLRRHPTGATLLITANSPGLVTVGHRTVHLATAGTARIKVSLTNAQLSKLSDRHALTLRIRERFVPRVGRATTKAVAIRFRT